MAFFSKVRTNWISASFLSGIPSKGSTPREYTKFTFSWSTPYPTGLMKVPFLIFADICVLQDMDSSLLRHPRGRCCVSWYAYSGSPLLCSHWNPLANSLPNGSTQSSGSLKRKYLKDQNQNICKRRVQWSCSHLWCFWSWWVPCALGIQIGLSLKASTSGL